MHAHAYTNSTQAQTYTRATARRFHYHFSRIKNFCIKFATLNLNLVNHRIACGLDEHILFLPQQTCRDFAIIKRNKNRYANKAQLSERFFESKESHAFIFTRKFRKIHYFTGCTYFTERDLELKIKVESCNYCQMGLCRSSGRNSCNRRKEVHVLLNSPEDVHVLFNTPQTFQAGTLRHVTALLDLT